MLLICGTEVAVLVKYLVTCAGQGRWEGDKPDVVQRRTPGKIKTMEKKPSWVEEPTKGHPRDILSKMQLPKGEGNCNRELLNLAEVQQELLAVETGNQSRNAGFILHTNDKWWLDQLIKVWHRLSVSGHLYKIYLFIYLFDYLFKQELTGNISTDSYKAHYLLVL